VETLWRAGLNNAVSATFLALLVACLGRVLTRRPAVLHCLWVLVLLKLLAPPLLHVPLPWRDPFAADRAPASVMLEVTSVRQVPAADVDPRDVPRALSADDGLLVASPAFVWRELSEILWLAGIVTTLAVSAWRIARFRLLLREASPVDAEMQDWVDELAVSLGLVRAPSVWWIGGPVSPLVWSLGGRPRLIIPVDLWKGLDSRQRTTLVVHELAHLRRGDHHVRFLELVVTALYWWHPVVWLTRRSLRAVEEQCCDAWVVWAFPDAARSYAETLLETLDFLNHSDLSEPLLASGFGKVRHLRKRLTMIMNGTTPRLVGVWGTLGSLALGVLLLPMNATWAQNPDEKKQVRIIVTADDIITSPGDLTVVEDGAETDLVLRDAIIVADGAPAGQVVLELKSNGQSTTVTADSIDEAIAKLLQEIKAISKKTPVTDTGQARIKVLNQAIRALKTADDKSGEPGSLVTEDVRGGKQAVQVRRIYQDRASGAGAGTQADIEAERRTIEKLTKALHEHQKQLAEARKKLAELQALAAADRAEKIAESSLAKARARKESVTTGTVSKSGGKTGNFGTTSTSTSVSTSSSTSGGSGSGSSSSTSAGTAAKPAEKLFVRARVTGDSRPGDADQKRLAELEKKLDKLLEEVASLKKSRAK
jgi:bla regulator protein blaR1